MDNLEFRHSYTEYSWGTHSVSLLEAPSSMTKEEIQKAVDEYICNENNKIQNKNSKRLGNYLELFDVRPIEFNDMAGSYKEVCDNEEDEEYYIKAYDTAYEASDHIEIHLRGEFLLADSDIKKNRNEKYYENIKYYAVKFKDIHNTVYSEEYNKAKEELDKEKAFYDEQEKHRKVECPHCESAVNVNYIRNATCPVCSSPLRYSSFIYPYEIRVAEKLLEARKTKEQNANAPVKWMIGIFHNGKEF